MGVGYLRVFGGFWGGFFCWFEKIVFGKVLGVLGVLGVLRFWGFWGF